MTPATKAKKSAPKNERRRDPLASSVRVSLERYLSDLDGHSPDNLYQMVLEEIERPLFEIVMQFTGGNQSKAAEMLGINRGTLRKKLGQHNIG
ncbi:MAG: Fis family transcriptional regulator factor for inversion stimulation protein [Gammaproteobacteria bacterium]|nr:MAG: Fis family transcriptional regulator factor for inversion stimulation protein [Gammaproteobacteria bacterium]TND05822.1 MAG: Fis family transcriptional regulator, factor for inversion stimulation protein [Gammaproteobacteria bacterium]